MVGSWFIHWLLIRFLKSHSKLEVDMSVSFQSIVINKWWRSLAHVTRKMFLFRITNRYIYNQILLTNFLWNAFFWKDMCSSLHSWPNNLPLLKGSINMQLTFWKSLGHTTWNPWLWLTSLFLLLNVRMSSESSKKVPEPRLVMVRKTQGSWAFSCVEETCGGSLWRGWKRTVLPEEWMVLCLGTWYLR